MDRGIFLNNITDLKIIEEIKQKFFYVSLDLDHNFPDLNRYLDKYNLPDQTTIDVDREKYTLPE